MSLSKLQSKRVIVNVHFSTLMDSSIHNSGYLGIFMVLIVGFLSHPHHVFIYHDIYDISSAVVNDCM